MDKMSVKEMCSAIGWGITDLMYEARIAWATARNAYEGKEPSPRTKRDICSALGRAFGRTILPSEIAWADAQ